MSKKEIEWMPPMLATLYKEEPFDDEQWLFEPKFDGERCLIYYNGEEARLMSRNQKNLSQQYPEIARQAPTLTNASYVIDGELVINQGKMGSFAKMQQRMGKENPSESLINQFPAHYFVFDLLYYDGSDLREEPLEERKKKLKKLSFNKSIHYTDHIEGKGKAFREKMRRENYEGAIAKDKSCKYFSSRSKKWLKLKCQHQQEFVIGGFTDPKRSRIGFGALLVGVYDGEEFVYSGKVGTGYSEEELEKLHAKLSKITRKTTPYDQGGPEQTEGVHWVTPKIVCEVRFTEWTEIGLLRHPTYIGLRDDKDPKEVANESKN